MSHRSQEPGAIEAAEATEATTSHQEPWKPQKPPGAREKKCQNKISLRLEVQGMAIPTALLICPFVQSSFQISSKRKAARAGLANLQSMKGSLSAETSGAPTLPPGGGWGQADSAEFNNSSCQTSVTSQPFPEVQSQNQKTDANWISCNC